MKTLVLFLLVYSASVAQVKGIVRDSVSGKPVAFANLQVKGGTVGATSEQDGTFKIDAKKNDSIVISAIRYNNKTVASRQLKEVSLVYRHAPLYEIQPLKKSKEKALGGLSKSHYAHSAGQAPWIYAKKFEYNQTIPVTPFLKEVKIFTDAWKGNSSMRIRVFDVDKSGCPGKDLLLESVIVPVKGGNRETTADLSKYALPFPKDGIFIAVEWLLVDDNKYPFNYLNSATGKPVKSYRYDPALRSNRVSKSTGYQYSGGRWHRLSDVEISGLPKGGKQGIEPAFELTLTN